MVRFVAGEVTGFRAYALRAAPRNVLARNVLARNVLARNVLSRNVVGGSILDECHALVVLADARKCQHAVMHGFVHPGRQNLHGTERFRQILH